MNARSRPASDADARCGSALCLLSRRSEGLVEAERTAALVLPGGGMLGTWQAGFLAELSRSEIAGTFDLVVGCSAGAINGAYFAAGQAEDCLYAYTDVLASRRFVNPARVWKMMDIDFLIDDVVAGSVPLDLKALRASKTTSHIVLTELTTGEAHLCDGGHGDILEALRATAAAPIVYGRAPTVGGARYLDGALSAPFPVKEAFGLGATDAVVVTPHPQGRRWDLQTGPVDAALAAWCHLRSPQAGVTTYRRAPHLFDSGMELCENPPDESLVSVFPSEAPDSKGFVRWDSTGAQRAAASGAASFRRFLETVRTCAQGCR